MPLGNYSDLGYPIKAYQDKKCVLCLLWYPFFTPLPPEDPKQNLNKPQIRKEVKLILPWQKMFPVSWSRWSTLQYLDAQDLGYSTLKFSFLCMSNW